MIASHAVQRRSGRSASGALLAGLIHDDRGNRMSPSFTLKDGVRYRFYVSTALLQGRKADAGTIGRIKATTIEKLVLTALRRRQAAQPAARDNQLPPTISQEADAKALAGDAAPTEADRNLVAEVDRIVITTTEIRIWLKDGRQAASAGSIVSTEAAPPAIMIPWLDRSDTTAACLDPNLPPAPDFRLIHAVVRARLWLQALDKGHPASVDDLAAATGLHAKIVRLNFRLAFLPPDIISAIMEGRQPPHLTASTVPQNLPLSWHKQRQEDDRY